MKYLQIADMKASAVSLGCMRINNLDQKGAANLLTTAVDNGINFFDHANIYGGGTCEEIFAKAMKDASIKREDILIQSKCGITSGYFDFSYDHIIESVDKILKRLDTEYLDVLLLHRPDTLMEPEEVAKAFEELHTKGKVRNFGMSNQNSMQLELLQQSIPYKLQFNQLQFSAAFTRIVDSGITVNTNFDNGVVRDGAVLEYCRLKNITIQPWSPFQYGFFEGVFIGSDKYPELNACLEKMAEKYGTTPTGMAVAWILRHPANMQPIVGTTNAGRVEEIAKASDIVISRADWYEIYKSAGNIIP